MFELKFSLKPSKLSSSPHGGLSSSPPVGSMPKSFPPFQHPSNQLLEENGFQQQKYVKYHKRCLNDRKKLGIGCSEVDFCQLPMNNHIFVTIIFIQFIVNLLQLCNFLFVRSL
ncbi:La-related protein 1A [Arachis hypogaea]|nr:La-related protein 1A [Arachis hypogaea]